MEAKGQWTGVEIFMGSHEVFLIYMPAANPVNARMKHGYHSELDIMSLFFLFPALITYQYI